MCSYRSYLLLFGLIVCPLLFQASAQSSEFNSIEELHASYVQNENLISDKLEQIVKSRNNQRNKQGEIIAFQPKYLNAAKNALNAKEILIAKQNESTDSPTLAIYEIKKLRTDYREKVKVFAKFDIQLRSLKKGLESAIQAEKSGGLAVLKLKKRKLEIIGQSEFFNSPIVSDVLIVRESESPYKRDILYSKSWQANNELELINYNIENKLLLIKDFERMLVVAKNSVSIKRDEFMAAHKAWEAKNDEYGSQFMTEALLRIFLEYVDVGIAIYAKGGPSPPAVLFELIWRGKDAMNYNGWMGLAEKDKGDFAYELPKVTESYIDYVKSLAQSVDGGRDIAQIYGRPNNVVDNTVYGDSFIWKLKDDEVGEVGKSILGFTATTLAEAKIQRNLAKNSSWWSLYMTSNGSWDDAYKAYKKRGGSIFDNFRDLRNHLRQGDDSFYTMFMNTLDSKNFKLNAIIDVGKSLGYTFVKDGVNELKAHDRFETYRELTKLEIAWLIRRNEYNKAMWFREDQKRSLENLYQQLGNLYSKKYEACCGRELIPHQNLDISTSQITGKTKLKLLLKMSEPVKQELRLEVGFKGQSKSSFINRSLDNDLTHQIELEELFDDSENFEGGELTLTIKAMSDTSIPLDGKPQTLAVYHVSDNKWEGLESIEAGDQTHSINFIKPKLSLNVESVLPKPEKVPIEATFLSVNSFPKEAFIAIYPVSKENENVSSNHFSPQILNGKVSGIAQLTASLEPGDYEVRLDDGFGDFAAKTDLSVKAPKGLLNMKAFDKDDKEIGYYVRIFKEEEETKVLKGVSGVDLTEELDAGKYKLFFSVDTENIERNVEIKEGETSNVEIHLKGDDDNKEEEEEEEEEVKFLSPAPPGWAKGTLHNSNDSDCTYSGEYLIFMLAGQRGSGRFLNRETYEFSQFVAVDPGKELEVAVPADGIFIRVFSTTVLPEDLSTVPWSSISHGTMSNLVDGWWYQAGCNNGTKRKSKCDNGKGSGPSTPLSCNTRDAN